MSTATAAWTALTQDKVEDHIRKLLAAHAHAEALAEAAQSIADAAQDRADDYSRDQRDANGRLQLFVDAIRENRPDLTIPEP